MKGKLALILCGVLAACGSCSKPSDGISVEAHGYGNKKPIHKVYLESKGPQHAAERFAKVLAVAFLDHGLELETDRKKAEAVVKVRAEEETGPKPLYAKMLTVQFSTRDGKTHTIDACQYTSEQPILAPETWSYPDRVYLVDRLREEAPGLASFYVGPIKNDKNSALSNAVKAELVMGNYTLAPDRDHADASIEEAKPHAGEIPMVALQQRIFLTATVDGWTGYSFTTNASRNIYRAPEQSLPDAVRPCSTSLSSYTGKTSRDPTWDAAEQLANSLAQQK